MPFSSLKVFKTIFFLFYSVIFLLISGVFTSGGFCHIGWQEDRHQCQGLNAKNAVIAIGCSSPTRATRTGKTTVANPRAARPALIQRLFNLLRGHKGSMDIDSKYVNDIIKVFKLVS